MSKTFVQCLFAVVWPRKTWAICTAHVCGTKPEGEGVYGGEAAFSQAFCDAPPVQEFTHEKLELSGLLTSDSLTPDS